MVRLVGCALLTVIPRIYTLEKQTFGRDTEDSDTERSVLITDRSDPDVVFRKALDKELQKIAKFYIEKEREIFREIDVLAGDMEEWERGVRTFDEQMGDSEMASGSRSIGDALATFRIPSRRHAPDDDDSDDDDDYEDENNTTGLLRRLRKRPSTIGRHSAYEGGSRSGSRPRMRRRSSTAGLDDFQRMRRNALFDAQVGLAKRCVAVFVSLRELKSYIQLNKTGFSKALKKYDKTLMRSLRQPYIESVVNQANPFLESTMKNVDTKIATVEQMYGRLATDGDIEVARRELRLHLREHVVWERNTVWREMIGIERKAQAANMGLKRTLLGSDPEPGEERLQGDDPYQAGDKKFYTPIGNITCPSWLFSGNFFVLLGCLCIFVLLLTMPIMKSEVQQNCLAMLVFVSLLWATEVGFLPLKLGGIRIDQSTGDTSFCHIPPHPILGCLIGCGAFGCEAIC